MFKNITLVCGTETVVDRNFYEKAIHYKWYLLKGQYAARNEYLNGKKVGTVLLHQEAIGFRSNHKFVVDHINRNTLDNRLENLRVVTQQSNSFNRGANKNKESSQYKGVFWSKERNLWLSIIKIDSIPKNLGYFENEIDAAIAYNSNAVAMFGEYAWLNDVPLNEDWWKKRVFIRENSTGFRGVSEQKPGKWQARITVDGKRLSLGYFENPIAAAQAYNGAAIKYHREKALLNKNINLGEM